LDKKHLDEFLVNSDININDLKFIEEELPEIVNDLNEGLARIQTIVRNVSSYARTHDVDKDQISVNQAILSTLHLMKSRLTRGVKLKTNFGDIPHVFANMNEIKQVIVNISVNALDAMDNSGVLTVTTSLDNRSNHTLIKIKDTGPGLSKEKQLKIFDSFYTSKSAGEGTGLGLYISHQIIAAHGGFIDLESNEGGGAEFIIHLPLNSKDA